VKKETVHSFTPTYTLLTFVPTVLHKLCFLRRATQNYNYRQSQFS